MDNLLFKLLDYYDIALIYHSNTFFVIAPVISVALGYLALRSLKSIMALVRHVTLTKPAKLSPACRRIHKLYLRAQKQYKHLVTAIENEILLPEDE